MSGSEMIVVRSAGQPERINPLTCALCGAGFEARNRNDKTKRFCSRQCKTRWHNRQMLTAAAALKVKRAPVRRTSATRPRTLDELAGQQGLPAGCYPPGALGQIRRRTALAIVPGAERLGLLLDAAHRLGLTESEAVKAARRHAFQEIA